MEWPEPDAVVIRDVFPATVTLGPSTWRSARLVVTLTHVYVFVAAPSGGQSLAFGGTHDGDTSRVPPLNAPSTRNTVLTVSGGATLQAVRQRGCGCGNPLKHWTPWRPYRKAATA